MATVSRFKSCAGRNFRPSEHISELRFWQVQTPAGAIVIYLLPFSLCLVLTDPALLPLLRVMSAPDADRPEVSAFFGTEPSPSEEMSGGVRSARSTHVRAHIHTILGKRYRFSLLMNPFRLPV